MSIDPTIGVTLKSLTSKAALHAYDLARYRLRHNARYHGWSDDKRTTYCLKKAFEAAAKEQK